MTTDTEDAGFLSRWSRRKAQVRQGVVVAEVPAVPAAAATAPATTAPVSAAPLAESKAADEQKPVAENTPPPPTLADVAALTHDCDYSRFVGRSVQPDVRNAALGKLFTDPHFNIMDGLDTYIDDYGKPDPLPEGMLRKLMQSHSLGLFDHEKNPPDPVVQPLAQSPAQAPAQAPAQPPALPTGTAPTPLDTAVHENTDLQLQPVDDAGCPGPAPGAGQDAGRTH